MTTRSPKTTRREALRTGAALAALLAQHVISPRGLHAFGTTKAADSARRSDILIIGAGASGLAAARRLTAAGKSVIILEARDRIGGRVWTNRSWPDAPIDLGASWIHGHDGNPIAQLAAEFNVATKVSDFASVALFDDQGQAFKPPQVVEALTASGDLKSWLAKLKRDVLAGSSSSPTTLEGAIARCQQDHDAGEPTRRLQRMIARNEIESDYAADLDELAFPAWDDGELFGGQQRNFPGGYGQIIDGLARHLDIRIKTMVHEIDFSSAPLRVVTSAGDFEADRVLVTVPLGVLKRGSIRFRPELPLAKHAAIARLGMGLLDKVYLRFDQAFWPEKDIVAFLTDQPRQWPDIFNLNRVIGQPILVAFKGGRAARADEACTDDQLVSRLTEQLRLAFGERVGAVKASHVTRWAGDPFSFGSYSYLREGSSLADRDELAAPVSSRLFFAGEATHRDHASTVHGAYLSGLREADKILAA